MTTYNPKTARNTLRDGTPQNTLFCAAGLVCPPAGQPASVNRSKKQVKRFKPDKILEICVCQ